MNSSKLRSTPTKNQDDFDATMAQLLVLVTHHSLTGCQNALQPIVDHLEALCTHSDLEFFPQQREVMLKMRKLWLLEQSSKGYQH